MSYLAAILTSVLVIFSFPFILGNFEFLRGGMLAWIALVPLFFVINKENPRKTFILMLVSSLLWYAGSLFWVYNAMHNFGGMSPIAGASVTFILVAMVSIFISLFVTLGRWCAIKLPGGNLLWVPFFWTAAEWARNYMPANGFPWANLAMSQWTNIPVMQMLSVTGVYGLIFFIVFINQYLATAISNLAKNHKTSKRQTIIAFAMVLAVLSFGYTRSTAPFIKNNNAIMIGAIQPNITQDMKWDPKELPKTTKIYTELTKRLATSGSEIIVWPESSLQLSVPIWTNTVPKLANFVPKGEILVTGLLESSKNITHNSVFALEFDGSVIGKYRKTHLVPFGEYVPYKKLLFFINKIVAPPGDFVPGERALPIKTDLTTLGPLVCYEDVFPEVSRELVKNGAEILINVTNDAWYGVTSAANQHLALSIMRSVETNRYMVRSTNTGVSAIISPRGHIITATPLFEEAIIAAPVFPLTNITFFVKYGDWFPLLISIICVLGLIAAIIKKFRSNN